MDNITYYQVLNNIPVGYACHQRFDDGRDDSFQYEIIESNQAFEEITGISHDEAIGMDSAFILGGAEKNSGSCRDVHISTHYYAQKVETKFYSEVRQKWYGVSAFRIMDDFIVTTLTESSVSEEEPLLFIREKQAINYSDILINTMMAAFFEKNSFEMLHAKRVGRLCELMVMEMKGLQADSTKLKQAGMLHDIGKIAVSSDLINKRGVLTKEDENLLMLHSKRGYRILSNSMVFSDIADLVYMHHERLDGSGFPRGLKGAQIPKEACIVAVAEAYESMTSYRPYKATMNMQDALDVIKKQAGIKFDSDVVDVLWNLVQTDQWNSKSV